MRAHDFRNLGVDELAARVEQMQGDLRMLTESVRLGKEKNHTQLRQLRADIARAKTVLREKT